MKLHYLIIFTMLTGIIIFLASCAKFSKVSFEKTLFEKVYIDRTNNGDYVLSFAEDSNFDNYTIYQGTKVEDIDWSKPIAKGSTNPLVLKNYDFSDRYFFGIVNDKGERLVASERLIPMEGVLNFRDLGGIPTKDGRVVKWGKFYRSGKLSELSKRDLRYFATLGIKTVADFRDDIEIKEDPNRYPENYVVERIRMPIGDASGNMQRELRKTIRKANPDNFDSEKFVADVMVEFIDSFAFQYKPFMEYISNVEKTPLLFHCTAGKDRTGMGAAFLLAMLGVEREVIFGDYLMSNYYRNKKINKSLRKATLVGVQQKIAQPLVEVKSSYIAAAFEAMDKKYGSVENFLLVEYGLDEIKLAAIRNEFLMSNDNNVEVVEPAAPILEENGNENE